MPKVVNIEPTPNPDALKFVTDAPLLRQGIRSFRDFASAIGDTLASGIFAQGKVTSVFYMDRFVTVNKHPDADWSDLIDPICERIEDFSPEEGERRSAPAGSTDEKLARIEEVIERRIKPGLEGDGGGLEILSFDGTLLEIQYQGACGSCPSAAGGTLAFIEGVLRDEVDPEIRVMAY
nr:NifU N-terminal domain-containing protein [uncultured Holophaga sp.]